MTRAKSIIRRFPAVERRSRKQPRPFEIKEILPRKETVDIKKNGQVVKTKVRRRSRFLWAETG